MSMSHNASAFLQSVLKNGIGRYVCQVQRLTLQFSKAGGSAKGVRDFIEQDVIDFAEKNPQIVLYVTPHKKYTHPKVIAEFLNGTKRSINLANFTRDEVVGEVNLLRTQSGLDVVRIRKQWHTDSPSVQGHWHPFYHKPTALNLDDFPSASPTYSKPERRRLPEMTEDLVHELKELKETGK